MAIGSATRSLLISSAADAAAQLVIVRRDLAAALADGVVRDR